MKIERMALLCADDPHHDYFVSLMQQRFNVTAVIREPYAYQRSRLYQRGKYIDYFYSAYHHARRTICGLNRYRRDYFKDLPLIPEGKVCSVVKTVRAINEPTVVDMLNEAKPDITAVMGTSIIKNDVLKAAGPCIINIHGGFLPDYRGNHCFFFALYNQDYGKIGSTIHFINAGIDTGDIIEVVKPPVYVEDNAEKLYCRAEKIAIHRLAELIHDVNSGKSWPRILQPYRGKLYNTRDRQPWHDLRVWARKALFKKKIARYITEKTNSSR